MGKKKHGLSHTRAYRIWLNIKRRCYAPKDGNYYIYGARGIYLDIRWHDFLNFYNDIGKRLIGKLQIDRIDNDGPYSKENCQVLTPRENCLKKARRPGRGQFPDNFTTWSRWHDEMVIRRGL